MHRAFGKAGKGTHQVGAHALVVQRQWRFFRNAFHLAMDMLSRTDIKVIVFGLGILMLVLLVWAFVI